MRLLPPLNAIKTFEVAARTGSFVLAAAELNVSPAAVSQQVRNLETYFGKSLFSRTGNRITLTGTGNAIFSQAARALDDLAEMTSRLLEGELRTRLVISAPSSLADLWLSPKLAKFAEFFPHATIDVRVEDDPIDLARQNIDLRIGYGDYHYPALRVIQLVHDDVLPMCAPEFLRKVGNDNLDLMAIHESLFIHTNWGPAFASHPTWSDWFAKAGIGRQPDPSLGRRAGLSSLAISWARMGLGVALGQRVMAQSDLDAGRLIALSEVSTALGHPYCAFIPASKAERADIKLLVELLQP